MRRRRRSAYTLLEVVLALLIGVLLLAALYGAIGYQLRSVQAGRDAAEQTTLVRAIVARVETDAASTIGLADPARFRNASSQGGAGGPGGMGMSSGSGASGAATPSSSTTTPSGATAASGTGTAGTTSGSGSSQGSASSEVTLPLGVMGDSSSLMLYVSKVPAEAWPSQNGQGQLVSDLRRICYWVDGDRGLCRQELRIITSSDALDTSLPPSGDTSQSQLAREVKSIEISYFDGSNWQTSWDSTQPGDDGITPVGSPRCIAIRFGILPRRGGDDGSQPELKYYRHVIAIRTANGATQANNNTTQTSTGAGSSP
jgi:hypothetical protein